MNKKGFTLTELLGVIVVLAVIIGIAGMSATSIMNKSKNRLYCEMHDNLKDAAIAYALANRDKNTYNIPTSVTVGTLISEGYFEDDKGYCNKGAKITLSKTDMDYDAIVPDRTCGNVSPDVCKE